jgi:replicative DNA helicase
MATRIPPQHLEAEQSILGSLMLDNEAWDHVADILDAEDFYKPQHNKIFKAIQSLHGKNQPVDLITVSNTLQTIGEIDAAGGTGYLAELVNKTISSVNITSYAKIVREKSTLRKMIQASSEVIERAYDEEFTELSVFLDQSEERFYKLGESKKTEGLVNPLEIVKNSIAKIEDLYKRKADITGVPSGFAQLDHMTSGLHGGELLIVAARPSMGKTAFSLNLAQHIALRAKKTVAYFSLEMSREAVMIRLLASEARINMKDIRSGKISDSAWPKLIQAAGLISDSSLYIDDTSGISPTEVRARARRLKSQFGLDCIMIDYLQLMDLKQKVESRERAVSEISKSLKSLAKELDVPVIALAQLNRGVEGRTEKRPMLSDLRESGSIEQDADVIMMLYREDYYDKENQEVMGNAEIIIGKQRNGPTGTVKLRWEAEFGRFRDADPAGFNPGPQAPPPQNNSPQNSSQQKYPQAPSNPPSGVSQGNFGKPRNFAPGAGV